MCEELKAATAKAEAEGITPAQLAVIVEMILLVIGWFRNRQN